MLRAAQGCRGAVTGPSAGAATVRRMQIILVRHAQPRWAERDAAVVDPGLTELGQRQAAALARRARTWEGIDEVVVSTARRAQETSKPLAEALDLAPASDDWLHEIRMPESWEGTPSEEVGRVLMQSRSRPLEDWWEGLPEGESFRDFHHRVCSGLGAALAQRGVTRHNDDPNHLWHVVDDDLRIVMVAHAGTNSVILGYLLGLDPMPWEWERFASDHASITVLQTSPIASGWIWGLQRFSDVGHLAPDDVSY